MDSLSNFTNNQIQYVFTDIDDTLTKDGRLGSVAYDALWKLHDAGVKVIPVTGRPAGWCELIARQWPVAAVVGENGGFYFNYENKTMNRHFVIEQSKLRENRKKLNIIADEVLKKVPGSAIASDQFSRLMDLAIDFCEDVTALGEDDIDKIVDIFKAHGAIAKVSSIHVNGWFGEYDKLTCCQELCRNIFGFELKNKLSEVAFVGDSPNDEPMFHYFESSFAVANVRDFQGRIKHLPKFSSPSPFGEGFAEIANKITSNR